MHRLCHINKFSKFCQQLTSVPRPALVRNMSTISLGFLKFIKPAILADSLGDPKTSAKTAIIDVRDSDHIGGHIKGSQWIPSHELDARMLEVLRQNADKDRIVFHCMLSQQRGPKAALAYARAKQQRSKGEQQQEIPTGSGKINGQEICVLEGGFEVWQSIYGEDESLTEGYAKEIWQ